MAVAVGSDDEPGCRSHGCYPDVLVFSEDNPQYVLLIGVLAVGAFLIMESHCYREYDAWRYRVRLLQRYFIADVSDPEHATDTDWREHLAENLRNPKIPISRRKSIAHRLVHVYLLLFTVLIGAWTLRITVFDPDSTWLETASISNIPGIVVVGIRLSTHVGTRRVVEVPSSNPRI